MTEETTMLRLTEFGPDGINIFVAADQIKVIVPYIAGQRAGSKVYWGDGDKCFHIVQEMPDDIAEMTALALKKLYGAR